MKYVIAGWSAVIVTVIMLLCFFAAWSTFRKIKTCYVILFFIGFLLISYEFVLVSEIQKPLTFAYFMKLLYVPIIPSFIFMFLFGKWGDSHGQFKELLVVLGIIHVAIMMVLASSDGVHFFHKVVANIVYLALPAFFLYQITESKDKE